MAELQMEEFQMDEFQMITISAVIDGPPKLRLANSEEVPDGGSRVPSEPVGK